MTPDDLTPRDRELAQEALARIYEARLKRREWAREFVRDPATKLVRPRVYALKKFAPRDLSAPTSAPDTAVRRTDPRSSVSRP
jgi:hypothetical protein